MGFTEVSSLDAEVTIALGKINKKTGKAYPKQAEGYYLGSRTVENKRGESKIHFLKTDKGNLGVWGTTDLDRKLSSVGAGTMVRITSTGTKPTPNGDMYTYKVEQDKTNTIEVEAAAPAYANDEDTGYDEGTDDTESEDYSSDDTDEDAVQAAALAAAERAAANKAKVEALLKGKGKAK